uniref:Retrovirus-related Pol polyprotein from transposon TNT 1-94-like beta-barrel domain-containing protein n=1 Tax=Chenopodium quinoa TaxID=63459 RepID=A0A803MM02_CHEQI
MEEGKLRIKKFDAKDFGFQKMQIEDYLYQKNLYLPLTSKPSGMKEDEWKVLDRQALGVIRLTLAKSVAYNVKDVTTTVGVIKALSNVYEKPSAMNKLKCYDVRDLILSESLRRKNLDESSGGDYFSEGHTKRECPNPKKKGGSNHKNYDDANSSILDSGASFHYSPCKEIFQNFKSGKFEKVYLADDEPLDIMGKRDVMIKTSSGSSWKLEDVRLWDPKNRKIVRHSDITFDESSLYKDNFGGKSVEKESIGDEWEFVKLDGEVRSGKEVEQVEVEVPIQQASPQHGSYVPVDLDSSDSDDDDHLETDKRVVIG